MKPDDKGGIVMPRELRKALAEDPGARAVFDRLPPSHRREYAGWVGEAKQAETRARRARRAVEMLRMIGPG